MGREPRVDRYPEEEWQIVQEGIKSGNLSDACRRHGIAPNLFYRWRDEAEEGAKAALGGRSAAAAETEKDPSLPGAGNADAGIYGYAGGRDLGHQPVESVLPEEAPRQSGGSPVRRAGRGRVRRKTGVCLSTGHVVAASTAARERSWAGISHIAAGPRKMLWLRLSQRCRPGCPKAVERLMWR